MTQTLPLFGTVCTVLRHLSISTFFFFYFPLMLKCTSVHCCTFYFSAFIAPKWVWFHYKSWNVNHDVLALAHGPHLISHQGSNRPANLMVLWTFSQRAEQDKKKPVRNRGQVESNPLLMKHAGETSSKPFPGGLPGGDGNLSEAVEQHGGGEADKRHHGAVEEFQLSHQDIGCLSSGWDLLHEVEVNL